MTNIFKLKTVNGYVLKILIELLQNNLKTAELVIDKLGITMRMMNSNKSILFDINLKSEDFNTYILNKDKLVIGLNLNHLHRMLKSIKKKDSIQIFIDDKFPNELGIKVVPKDNNRTTTSFIKILSFQESEITLPTGYDNHTIVSGSDFQKTLRELLHIGKVINITSSLNTISFSSDSDGIMHRKVDFGNNDSEDDSEDEITFDNDFDTDILARVTKISSLSTNMKIYTKKNLPLYIKTNIGNIGSISVFIKCNDPDGKYCSSDEEDE